MSKEKKNRVVPRLRFPEFRETGEWIEKLVDEYFEVGSSKRVLLQDWTNQGVPFYRTRELVSLSKKEPFRSEIFISEELFSELKQAYGIPSEGDFLVSGVGTLGICYQVQKEDKFYFKDGNVLWFKIGSGLNSTYFKYCFQSDHIQNQIVGQASKSTVGTYTIQNAKKTKFWYPPTKPEQQKIATCLTTLDDLISAQGEKIKALQAHKKGLMQQIFPAEGETAPRVRFGEFEGEWEAQKLGELIDIKGRIGYRGYTVEDIVKEGEGAIALSPSNINDAGSLSFEKSTYITWYKYEESPEIMLEVGQTILVKTGSSYGRAAFVKELPKKCTINPQLVVLKPIKVNSVFLFLLVCHNSIQRQINEMVVGGAIPTLSQDSISKFEVLIPSKQEQQKIAACLTTLDELIAAQSQKLEALKRQKKGLMQQLFPSPKTMEE